MVFAIYVTEQITSSYEFETEAEAQAALESRDFMFHESDVVNGEVLDMEIVELPGHWYTLTDSPGDDFKPTNHTH